MDTEQKLNIHKTFNIPAVSRISEFNVNTGKDRIE